MNDYKYLKQAVTDLDEAKKPGKPSLFPLARDITLEFKTTVILDHAQVNIMLAEMKEDRELDPLAKLTKLLCSELKDVPCYQSTYTGTIDKIEVDIIKE